MSKSGAKGGFIGGGLSGALGGAMGGFIAGKFLPTNAITKDIVCEYDYDTTIFRFDLAMKALGGKEINSSSMHLENTVIIRTVGEGTFTGAQAVIAVEIIPIDDQHTRVIVTSSAKEGLIKRRLAEKFLNKVLENIKHRLV